LDRIRFVDLLRQRCQAMKIASFVPDLTDAMPRLSL
jgi:hypothetical protein